MDPEWKSLRHPVHMIMLMGAVHTNVVRTAVSRVTRIKGNYLLVRRIQSFIVPYFIFFGSIFSIAIMLITSTNQEENVKRLDLCFKKTADYERAGTITKGSRVQFGRDKKSQSCFFVPCGFPLLKQQQQFESQKYFGKNILFRRGHFFHSILPC